jgi:hypothetical protein
VQFDDEVYGLQQIDIARATHIQKIKSINFFFTLHVSDVYLEACKFEHKQTNKTSFLIRDYEVPLQNHT